MNNGQIILFQTPEGDTKIEVRLSNDTVWLTADQMAELFQRDKSTISRHIKNVLISGELQRDSVVAENATTASDGKTYIVSYYNLDMIISVGYRVNSHRGVQFRQWATTVLKEYMIKGFVLNDDLLKNAGQGNDDHTTEAHPDATTSLSTPAQRPLFADRSPLRNFFVTLQAEAKII